MPVRRALISVFDKSALVPFAKRLDQQGIALISTGGTARTLREAGLPVTDVSELTGFPEILGGRVKTLHPYVHGGLLSRRNDAEDMQALEELAVDPIDLVVANLYPFEEATSGADVTDAVAIENIDIGGPTMIRAAAKNFFFVGVVTSPEDYDAVADELERNDGRLSLATRRSLARRAFERTAAYDTAIARYFNVTSGETSGSPNSAVVEAASSNDTGSAPSSAGAADESMPATLHLILPRVAKLRYGENPHQEAALYGRPERFYEKLHGKELSFNNLIDLSAALQLIDEFESDVPTCAILKHTNPCGIAQADSLSEAYRKAFATDTQSPFGGIVVVNRPLDRATAETVDEIFTEIIIAPEFEPDVLEFLMQKKNRRIIRSLAPARSDEMVDVRSVTGGVLVQLRDGPLPGRRELRQGVRVVTERVPNDAEWDDLDFAWRVVKHVKSNAIVYVRDRATIGIGAGQMSRVDSSEIAVMKGRKSGLDFRGSVVASDAFFPFPDGLIAAAETGATAAIQPGGSIRDDEVIAAANERGMAMVFTGRRHFRH